MADEEINEEEKVEEVVADESQPETPQEEAPEEEAPQEEVAEEEQPEEKPEEPAEEPPSRREQYRIQQLLAKYGPPTSQNRPDPKGLDYEQTLDADPEVIKQLEADRQRVAEREYSRGIEEVRASEFRTNIRLDYPLVKDKLEKLDPVDVESLDREYLYTVGFNPETGSVRNNTIGYAEFVEARIEQAERLASRMNAETVRNVAKQAASTGLRPDGSSARNLNLNRDPKDMTLEELYASIGQKPPKK